MDLKIGDMRRFSFKENSYEIKEVLEPVDLKMEIIWDTGICPHCKKRISKTVNHQFTRIEILKDNTKKDKETIDDLIIIGHTLDNRTLLIEKDKYKEIFDQSSLFKHMSKEVI